MSQERVVSVFETTIRVLGGFLAAYELSDHPLYLRLAVDLGDRLLGAYSTMSGIPHADIHLRRYTTDSLLRLCSYAFLLRVVRRGTMATFNTVQP